MSYLMFENKGIASVDLLTVVGASTARDDDGLIGMFGTGFKHSVALLLRHHTDIFVYCGKDGYEFGVAERVSKDVMGDCVVINEIVMKQIAGPKRKTRNLSIDVGFGSAEWKDVKMAPREFASNGADASLKQKGDYSLFNMELVDSPRAKDGYTRVFVQATPQIVEYYEERRGHLLFLHKGWNKDFIFIPKENTDDGLCVYRKGILLGKFENPSLFNYNLNDVDISENRTIDIYDASRNIGFAYKNTATSSELVSLISAIINDKECFERKSVEPYHVKASSWTINNEPNFYARRKAEWDRAFRLTLGSTGVICENTHQADAVARKGYTAYLVSQEWTNTFQSWGGRVASDVLDHFDLSGRKQERLTAEQNEKCEHLWKTLESLGITKNKKMPELESYSTVMDAGSLDLGYYDPNRNVVGISKDVLDTGFGFEFVKVLLEEYVHYITGALDNTRDMQDICLRISAKLLTV